MEVKKKKKTNVRNAIFMYRYLRFCKCIDCGVKDPRVLQFDHVRGEKKDPVSSLVYSGKSMIRIKDEIRKCEIRCANCHTIKTHKFKYHI